MVFGLAQCERALEMWDAATQHFEEYLASKPPAAEAEAVRDTIAEIKAEREREPESASVLSNAVFWVMVGVIAAVVGVGIGVGVAASGTNVDGDF